MCPTELLTPLPTARINHLPEKADVAARAMTDEEEGGPFDNDLLAAGAPGHHHRRSGHLNLRTEVLNLVAEHGS